MRLSVLIFSLSGMLRPILAGPTSYVTLAAPPNVTNIQRRIEPLSYTNPSPWTLHPKDLQPETPPSMDLIPKNSYPHDPHPHDLHPRDPLPSDGQDDECQDDGQDDDGEIDDSQDKDSNPDCERVKKFWKPTPKDWQGNDIDQKFQDWLGTHMRNNSERNFESTWGEWALGNPEWSCSDDGSTSCQMPGCTDFLLTEKDDDDLRLAYYVTLSLIHLHSYYMGLAESFRDGGILAALSKDQWEIDFYKDPLKEDGLTKAKTGLGVAGIVIAVLTTIAGALTKGASIPITTSILGMMANTAPGIVYPWLQEEEKDESFQRAAGLGQALGRIFQRIIDMLTTSNNEIFKGTGDNTDGLELTLHNYMKDGAMINFKGVDIVSTRKQMASKLLSTAINWVWRVQKVFILGGGPCGHDGEEIFGVGPKEARFCRENRVWYLYQYGDNQVEAPHGMDKLGTGDYDSVTINDVFESSLAAYEVAGLNYTLDIAKKRTKAALTTMHGDPFSPSWEGTFSIPICNISMLEYYDEEAPSGKNRILKPYGKNPRWCGPICGNDHEETQGFLKAAHFSHLWTVC